MFQHMERRANNGLPRAWNSERLAITPHDSDARVGREVMQQAADLGRYHGGIVRIKRAIIIPAILALGAFGSILAGSAAPVAAASAPSVHVLAAAPHAVPHVYYHW